MRILPKWGNLPGLVSAVSGASVVFTVSADTSVDVSGFENMQGIPIVNLAHIILWCKKSLDFLQL